MTAVADRVAKLLALTTSTFEEEARSAAMAACRLIREHNLLGLLGDDDERTRAGRAPSGDREKDRLRRRNDELHAEIDELRGELAEMKRRYDARGGHPKP